MTDEQDEIEQVLRLPSDQTVKALAAEFAKRPGRGHSGEKVMSSPRLFIAACAVTSPSDRYAEDSLKSGYTVIRCVVSPAAPNGMRLNACRMPTG